MSWTEEGLNACPAFLSPALSARLWGSWEGATRPQASRSSGRAGLRREGGEEGQAEGHSTCGREEAWSTQARTHTHTHTPTSGARTRSRGPSCPSPSPGMGSPHLQSLVQKQAVGALTPGTGHFVISHQPGLAEAYQSCLVTCGDSLEASALFSGPRAPSLSQGPWGSSEPVINLLQLPGAPGFCGRASRASLGWGQVRGAPGPPISFLTVTLGDPCKVPLDDDSGSNQSG